MKQTTDFRRIIPQFHISGTVMAVQPMGNGLINDTYLVETMEGSAPDYVLQRINENVFKDVELLQRNIEIVTKHLRKKLKEEGATDIDRRALQFMKTVEGKSWFRDQEGLCWRLSINIPNSVTQETVNEQSAYDTGKAFGDFERMLIDVPEELGETIPGFHNMELKWQQLEEALQRNAANRRTEVAGMVRELEAERDEMCKAERLFREGKLPKRICHCDTKVNNILYDETGQVLCVVDLDTVMPSFIFSDYGDFLRTAANQVAEDDERIELVAFNEQIFKAFTKGYIESTASFLTPIERDNLPFAVALFPYMQSVRFLTDYINGDVYWKVKYPTHNLVRAKNQLALYRDVRRHDDMMKQYIADLK